MYIDYVLVIATEEELIRIWEVLIKKFQWMTIEIVSMQSYLGMQITLCDGTAEVYMSFYVQRVTMEYLIQIIDRVSPSKPSAFTAIEKEMHHMRVATFFELVS